MHQRIPHPLSASSIPSSIPLTTILFDDMIIKDAIILTSIFNIIVIAIPFIIAVINLIPLVVHTFSNHDRLLFWNLASFFLHVFCLLNRLAFGNCRNSIPEIILRDIRLRNMFLRLK